MARKDLTLYSAFRASTKIVGNHLEITTADFIEYMLVEGYPLTPAEANKFILNQPKTKVLREGDYGLHEYGFSH